MKISLEVIRIASEFSEPISPELMSIISQGEQIYVQRGSILVIPEDIHEDSLPHYMIYWQRYPSTEILSEKISRILIENAIEHINLDSYNSPDERFYYRSSPATIYNIFTNAIVVKSPLDNYVSSGWAHQQKGIILNSTMTECLIGGISISVSTPCLFPIPQPILLLRQDPQHLPPDIQAQFAAQDALEARNKQQADIVMAGLMIATVGSIAFTVRTRRRLTRKEPPVSVRFID